VLRYWLFQAHWLVGITAGVILAFVGATGALLSFETEILAWLNRDARVGRSGSAAPPPLPELLERLALEEPARGVVSVTVFGDQSLKPRVTFATPASREQGEPRRAGDPPRPRGEKPSGSRGDAFYVDAVGTQLSMLRGDRGEAFFRNVRSLHRWLTLESRGDRELGRQIVGACTLLLLGLAATGLYLRWPRRRVTQWRAWLTFSPRLRGRNLLWHLHAIVATWALAFYLVIGLTGLYWSYEWYRDGLALLSGASPPVARSAAKIAIVDTGPTARSFDPEATRRAWRAFRNVAGVGGFHSATLEWPAGERGTISIRYLPAGAPHPRAYDSLEIDVTTGQVVETRHYADKTAGDRLLASVFPLHSGRFFGMPGAVTFMIASLCMPLFAVTGWMLYLERRRRGVARRLAVAGTH
jgi:sulfite reductase (NADPH) flavoprotein alpha-component